MATYTSDPLRSTERLYVLTKWAHVNNFKINKDKTEGMESISKGQQMFCVGKKLAMVNSFRYLGVILQTSRVTYTNHVKEKLSHVIVPMNNINSLSFLFLEMAMKL
jgi:hypothetical protein